MAPADNDEISIRGRLGIPLDAEKIVVFGETSHWDPNWLYTSEEYYNKRIKHILDEVITVLERDSRRVFSIESIFFLRKYWEREPKKRAHIRTLVNDGRICLTGTGVTTPDTVLPDTEPIIRDYLIGQEWLTEHGMDVNPRLAYLPDNFGHSPALPSLMSALGFDKVGITRIDGMYFVATDYRTRGSYPLPGSSAKLLTDELKTLDFIWKAPDGESVLCHWNAFTYFQGDMLAHMGIIRWMGIAFGIPWRTGRHIARRIKTFVKQLGHLSKTPYIFCPIGCDFNGPIHHLVELMDRYNGMRYQETGIFAVNASMEDYLNLVNAHRDKLPVLELDPNPYWMGFYATRPDIKVRCNRIARKLMLAEKLTTLPNQDAHERKFEELGPDTETRQELAEAWDLLAVSNHHDYITGTSPDRVWNEEQSPWLSEAEQLVDSVIGRLGEIHLEDEKSDQEVLAPTWQLEKGVLEIKTKHYLVEIREDTGGCITSLESRLARKKLVQGPANDLVAYKDSGGLWRMGHEYRGGSFKEVERSSKRPAQIEVKEKYGALQVNVYSKIGKKPFIRRLWFRDDSPVIKMRIIGAAAKRTTITCGFPTIIDTDSLVMDVPGGLICRPRLKLYDPTFWAARTFAYIEQGNTNEGFAAFLGGPACVTLRERGKMEWVVLRNAPKEKAFVVLPLLAHPASGTDPEEHEFDYAVWFAEPGEFPGHRPPFVIRRLLGQSWLTREESPLDIIAGKLITTGNPDVLVRAIKHAGHGRGVIVRLASYIPRGRMIELRCPSLAIKSAVLCNARERDIEKLVVEDGVVIVPSGGTNISVRLLI